MRRTKEYFVIGLLLAIASLGLTVAAPDIRAPSALAGAVLGIGALIALLLALIRFTTWLVYGRRRQLEPAAGPSARHHWIATSLGLLLLVLYCGAALAWGPVSDSLVLAHADPAMIKLAQEAGMSRKGELVFLRGEPRLVSDQDMQRYCAANTAANNSNGFIEQGCYVEATNRIYLREMPTSLHGLEVATAAYEMLHPVYLDLRNLPEGSKLDKAIEANFVALNDSHLREQVTNFAKTEPGARDLELFSLLATGYDKLSENLNAYYRPYFTDIGKTVAANQNVIKIFEQNTDQLAKIKQQITHYEKLANSAYATSVSWAKAGSQYWDDYYYKQYGQYVDKQNAAIKQYNTLLKSYNTLVTEYNGTQPVKQLNPTQAQGQ